MQNDSPEIGFPVLVVNLVIFNFVMDNKLLYHFERDKTCKTQYLWKS